MKTYLLSFSTILALALATHAALDPENYWKSMLPNSPIPKAIRDALHPDFSVEESTSVAVGKGGVNVDAGHGKPGGTTVNVGKGGVHVNAGEGKPGGTSVNVGKGGVGVNTSKGKPGGGTSVNVGKGGVNVHAGKGKHFVNVAPFTYTYAASETQLHDDPTAALFFLERDLRPGTKMNLHFTKTSNAARFLPIQVAKSIPFSSDKFQEILNKLAVKPGSADADNVKTTIEACENPAIKGEDKYCATSLESMIDFSISKLGKKVNAISTQVDKETALQEYTITRGVKRVGGDQKSVVCHRQSYPYAVFYCHVTQNTRAYVVPLEGVDGTKAQAVAVCHSNTSGWNPKHLAFQVLKIKPGTVPVCHFLPEDHVVWALN